MSRFDDHVIPYEEVVRRRRALEEAQREKGVVREVKMSDAMSHLLEKATVLEEGPTPDQLRHIVEREFTGGADGRAEEESDEGGSGEAPSCRLDERPGAKNSSGER
jgi:hypothetical protein